MIAAADPSLTPEQSMTPSGPAMFGEHAIASFGTSRRNCARGLSAPLWWFFHAIRVSTSFICSASTPYRFEYAGTSRLNRAGADSVVLVPSDAADATVNPEKPVSFNFSTPVARTTSYAPDATA